MALHILSQTKKKLQFCFFNSIYIYIYIYSLCISNMKYRDKKWAEIEIKPTFSIDGLFACQVEFY